MNTFASSDSEGSHGAQAQHQPERVLADLRPGELGIVTGYRDYDAPVAQRLMQMGLLRETPVRRVRSAPAGDPIEFRLLSFNLCLRRDEARQVLIRLDRAVDEVAQDGR